VSRWTRPSGTVCTTWIGSSTWFYGLASDEYGEVLTKHELGLVFSDTLDVTGSGDCVW
jgi:hypothetical protein